MTLPTLFARCAVVAAVLGAARGAVAQRTSYDLERLWLDPSARGSLVVGTGETLPAGGLRLAVAGGWERSPLVLTSDGLRGRGAFSRSERIGDLVRDRWTLHLVAAAGITDRLEIGARWPMTVSQHGDDLSSRGIPELRSALWGTPSGMLRYAMIRQGEGAGVSVAVAGEVAVPIRHSSDLDGDPGVFYKARVEVGHRFASSLVAAELEATLRPDAVALVGDGELRHELGAGVVAATTGGPLRLELSLRGAVNSKGAGAFAELLGGARYSMGPVELFGLAGPGFFEAPGTPTFRALLGLSLGTRAAAPEPAPAVAEAEAQPEAAAPPPVPEDPCALGGCPPPEAPAPTPAPSPARAALGAGKIDVREKVFFDTGKAIVQPRSRALLDDVATVIRDNPQAGRIRIEGHTDDRGPAALNRRLSQARAEAVRAELVSRGVDPGRLDAQGFGPDRPAASNRTRQGREANRRVEFAVLGVEE